MQLELMPGHGTTHAIFKTDAGKIACEKQKSVTCICQTGEGFLKGSSPVAIVSYEQVGS